MRFSIWRYVATAIALVLASLGAFAALPWQPTWQSEPFSSGLHYDSRHSGFSRLEGPKYPDANIKWLFTAVGIGKINSSCAIGPCEPFLDLGDKNGRFDDGEPYQDLNRNGHWDDSMIAFTSTGGFFYVLNPDGTLFWSYDTNSPMISSPAIGPGEPYYDANGNGCYDIAEPFTDTNGNGVWDLAEPFVDENDNGIYDQGEEFTDFNHNHRWDDAEPFVDANGDGLCSPAESFIDENGNGVRDRGVFYFGGDDGRLYALFSEICEEPYIDRNLDGAYTFGEAFTDWDGNGKWDRVRVKWTVATGGRITSSPVVNVQEQYCDMNRSNAHEPGEPFLDVFQDLQWNGSCEEYYIDLNQNGRYDADLPELFNDANHNGRRDGVMIYVGSHDDCVYGISESGQVMWVYRTGSWISSSPAVSLNGKVVFCGSDDCYLYAIDGSNGYLLWRRWLGSPVHASPCVDFDGNVYIGSDSPDNRIYAFAPNGAPLWSRSVGTWVHSSPAVGIHGDIYCGTYFDGAGQGGPVGKLFSILANGEGSGFLEEDPYGQGINLGSWVQSSPALDVEGNIYMVAGDNSVFSISPEGVIIGRMSLPTGIDADPQRNQYWIRSTAAIGPDETLYIGCWDGKLYALQRDVPSVDEPNILVAGYMESVLSESVDSVLEVRALVTDPENNVVNVWMFYDGINLGRSLKRAGYDEIADAMIFSTEFMVPGSYLDRTKAYALSLVAEDAVGNESQMWPYFYITRGVLPLERCAPDWRKTRDLEIEGVEYTSAEEGNSPPVVLMAGNPYSKVTYEQGGQLYIAALVTDPDGLGDIHSVIWKYPPLGVLNGEDITQTAIHGVYRDAVLYLYGFHVNPGTGPIALENYVIAIDREGAVSTQFPAITVVP